MFKKRSNESLPQQSLGQSHARGSQVQNKKASLGNILPGVESTRYLSYPTARMCCAIVGGRINKVRRLLRHQAQHARIDNNQAHALTDQRTPTNPQNLPQSRDWYVAHEHTHTRAREWESRNDVVGIDARWLGTGVAPCFSTVPACRHILAGALWLSLFVRLRFLC